MTKDNIKIIAGLAIGGAVVIYKGWERIAKGPKYRMEPKPGEKSHGDEFEDTAYSSLVQAFENRALGARFLYENRKGEIDAIVFHNANVVIIELKGWKGRIFVQNGQWKKEKIDAYTGERYENTIEKNLIKDLEEKCNGLARRLGKRKDIFYLLVFADECDVSEIKAVNNNICNLKDMIYRIKEITQTAGSHDRLSLEKLYSLPTWDRIHKGNVIQNKIITSDVIEVLDQNNVPVKLSLKDISSIEVRRHFLGLRKNDVCVRMKSGAQFKYFEDRAFFTVLEGKQEKKISLRTVDKIVLGSA